MQASLEALLRGAVDHEGARDASPEEVARALDEWRRIAQGPQRWALGRLLCPAQSLPHLATELLARPQTNPVPVLVDGGHPRGRAEWEDGLERAAREMNALLHHAEDRATIEAFLARPPDTKGLEGYLRDLRGFGAAEVYVEAPWGEEMEDGLTMLAESEWAFAAARVDEGTAWARFVHTCVALDLPCRLSFEGRAPVPLLAAAALAVGADLSRRELEGLPAEDTPEALFEAGALVWRGHRASLEEIEAARELLGAVGVPEPAQAMEGIIRKVR